MKKSILFVFLFPMFFFGTIFGCHSQLPEGTILMPIQYDIGMPSTMPIGPDGSPIQVVFMMAMIPAAFSLELSPISTTDPNVYPIDIRGRAAFICKNKISPFEKSSLSSPLPVRSPLPKRSKPIIKKIDTINPGRKIKEYKKVLNNIFFGFGGNKLKFDGSYVGEYKASHIVEALETAKEKKLEVVTIKPLQIDVMIPKLLCDYEGEKIVGGKIVRVIQPYFINIQNLSSFGSILDLLDRLERGQDEKASNTLKLISEEIEKLQEQTEYHYDPIEELERYHTDPSAAAYAQKIVDCLEHSLKPQVRLDENEMPVGSYLSVKLNEAIISVMQNYSYRENYDGYMVGFPLWLQKLIQTTAADDRVKICPDLYLGRYQGSNGEISSHPLLSIRQTFTMDQLYAYTDFCNETESAMLNLIESFIHRTNYPDPPALFALGFRAILLDEDLKEFDEQLRGLPSNDKDFYFVKEMKKRHIKQFEEQANKIPSFKSALIDFFPHFQKLFRKKKAK